MILSLLSSLTSHKQFASIFVTQLDLKFLIDLADEYTKDLPTIVSILNSTVLTSATSPTTPSNSTSASASPYSNPLLLGIKDQLMQLLLRSNDTLLLLNTILKVPIEEKDCALIGNKKLS